MIYLENKYLQIAVDPENGGRITSLTPAGGPELLWYDAKRVPRKAELDYDGNFAGGMDELLPCDIPEHGYPDHGELWMQPLDVSDLTSDSVTLHGIMPISQLEYTRKISLIDNEMRVSYTLRNVGAETRNFLWKLHAAMEARTGDVLKCDAACQQAASPADWSKAPDAMPRRWDGSYTIPAIDGTSDFFYLTDIANGKLELARTDGYAICCNFDLKCFPCVWIFASFGRLNDSRTIILEPCTNYPAALDEAVAAKCCASLAPNQTLDTTVTWKINIPQNTQNTQKVKP